MLPTSFFETNLSSFSELTARLTTCMRNDHVSTSTFQPPFQPRPIGCAASASAPGSSLAPSAASAAGGLPESAAAALAAALLPANTEAAEVRERCGGVTPERPSSNSEGASAFMSVSAHPAAELRSTRFKGAVQSRTRAPPTRHPWLVVDRVCSAIEVSSEAGLLNCDCITSLADAANTLHPYQMVFNCRWSQAALGKGCSSHRRETQAPHPGAQVHALRWRALRCRRGHRPRLPLSPRHWAAPPPPLLRRRHEQ